MNTRKLMWGIAALGMLAGGLASQASDLERRTKALWEELLGTASVERQIELKQELARLTLPEERPATHGRLDQGGENWSDAVILPPDPSISASGTTVGYANDFNVLDFEYPPNPCWTGYFSQTLSCAGPDVAYRYTVPITGSYRVQLCASNFDTGLLLYQYTGGPPNNFTDFICGNDDFCGLRSEFTTPLLFAGQEVLLVVDGWNTSAGIYEIAIELVELSIPPNDVCLDAVFLEPFVVVSGTTVDATPDPVPICGTSISAPGVWFATIGTGNTMSVQTCLGATYDTKLNVYTGSCSLLECVGGNDDACGLQSRVTWCSQAGQPYYILVQGFGGQTGNFTLMIEDDGVSCGGGPVLTIPDVYAQLPSLIGQEVTLRAHTTDGDAALLVDVYGIYMINEKMPPYFMVRVDGPYVSASYWHGVLLDMTGIIAIDPTAEPGYEAVLITNAPGPAAVPPQPTSTPPNLANWRTNWTPGATCDTCNFAILISGGVNATNNHMDYWDDLVDFYCYKRTHNYCESRTKVFYYNGSRPTNHTRRTEIPAGVVSACSVNTIQAHINAISAQVAACKRAGKKPTVEVVVSNHGKKAPNGGINMHGNGVLSPASFTAMMQKLCDSSATVLDIEMGQCYGGQMIKHLGDNLQPRGTSVTGASAAPDSLQSFSKRGDGGYNYWLNEKACNLAAGKNIHQAINRANAVYDSVLTPLASYCGDWARYYDATGQPATGSSWRACSTECVKAKGGGSYLRNFCLPKRCQSDTIQVTRGGRINLTFSGPAKSCGNCEVLCQDTSGKWIRQTIWNWNVPGSAGFVNGQNQRRIDSGGASNGIYVIHSRSDTFYVKATSTNPPLPPNLDTSPSNPETFAGFAVGWTSGTSDEFGAYAEVLRVLSNVDDLGFDLSTAPKHLGPGGVEIIQAHFDVAAQNYWWTEMNLYVGVLGGQAGSLIGFECPDCEIQNGQVSLSGGDQEVVLNVGSVNSLGSHYLNLFASSFTELDYWGLESAHSTGTPPPVGNLVITRDGDDIRLYWTAVPVAVNYMVQSSPNINGPWTTLTTTASTSYTHLNQANDATSQLYYQVIAVGP